MTLSGFQMPEPLKDRKTAQVLFVEDSQADIALTKAILKKHQIELSLHFLRDGGEAVDAFQSHDPFTKTIDLILIDFNLPKRNGIEVLSFIKQHDDFKDIPVIMLTGSDAPDDIDKAKALGVENYMVKPLHPNQLEKAIKTISSLEFVQENGTMYLYVTD